MKNGRIEQIKPFIASATPRGTIYLNPDKKDSLEFVFEQMGVENGMSFQMTNETRSRFSEEKFYRKYQEYYWGVKVDGGGYTEALIGPDGPDSPCPEALMIMPYILSDIDVVTFPSIPNTSLPSILQVEAVSNTELVISHNLSNQCEYNLTWKTSYVDEYPKLSWIDAHTGEILRTIDSRLNLMAPTVTYGPQWMNDRMDQNGTTFLESPDQRITTFYFKEDCYVADKLDNWTRNLVPSTLNDEWTTEASPETYQAFWVTSRVVPLFDDLGIHFGSVSVGSCDYTGAYYLEGGTDNPHILIGDLYGPSLALYDVIAHELTHGWLEQEKILGKENFESKAIREAICDIIATFIESLIQNNGVDWVVADDEPNAANNYLIDRNLQFPKDEFDCYTNANRENFTDFGLVLGHWYFLTSQGNQDDIPAIGMDVALDILLEAVRGISEDSGYRELMEATLEVTLDQFGRCSDEFLSIARAWEKICVTTGYANSHGHVDSCAVSVCGPSVICEEDDRLSICACGVFDPNTYFRFYIVGRKSTEYVSYCGMQGNMQEGCSCLTILDIPKYSYYPQYITVELFAPNALDLQVPIITSRRIVKIVDCLGDDPTCEDLYFKNIFLGAPTSQNSGGKKNSVNLVAEEIPELRVFDFLGRSIYNGNPNHFIAEFQTPYRRILVFVYYNHFGMIIKTEKRLMFNH
jgi:hypothetical protein